MEKEFLLYEEALALKELGFNEENIVGYYRGNRIVDLVEYKFTIENYSHIEFIPAPLYQQAFRFFREVKLIECFIKSKYVQRENVGFYFGIDDYEKRDYYSNTYFSYEEAELECLKKLIELCKKN